MDKKQAIRENTEAIKELEEKLLDLLEKQYILLCEKIDTKQNKRKTIKRTVKKTD